VPASPLTLAFYACAAFSGACWLLSLVTRNYSQVDRFWSIAPPLYVIGFAAAAAGGDARLDLMAVLATLWGARLTYNFARKGGYRAGNEDYRWEAVRKKIGPVGFQILNATFIAPYQNLILLLLTVPAARALDHAGAPLGPLDAIAAAGFLLFLAGETVADQQQWRFQNAKRARKERGEAAGEDFITTGLFRFSRHPNFFCEMAIWWCFALFAPAAGAPVLDLAMLGALLLTLLFQGSTALTERLTLEKYPSYAEYQTRTSRLIPLPPRASAGQ
jgi:steroid 5-alpha reductase family enzyme